MRIMLYARRSLRCLKSLHNFNRSSSSSITSLIQNSNIIDFNFKSIRTDIYNCNIEITNFGLLHRVEDARKLFDEMPQRDICSYTSMISVYLKHGEFPKAEKLFREMPERNVVVESAMIDGYAKAGRIGEARQLFDEMPMRNVFSWTSLISGYIQIGQINEARRLFYQMPNKNVVSWTTMVLGYARSGLIFEARDLFDRMPEKSVVSWTAMIKSYIENDQINDARKLFNEMPQRNSYSWNIMILAYLEHNRVPEAIELFESMPQRSVVSWTTMVTGLARNGLAENARQFFNRMPKKDVAAWNAMISAYVNDGHMIEASKLFNSMPERNNVTWNAMIDGYAKNRLENEALRHLILMLRTRNRPNENTLTSILMACEGTIEITQTHSLIISLGFDQVTRLTNSLITMYSKSGDKGSAMLAFEKLMTKDAVSWTAMILTFSNHGCGPLALQIFAQMLKSGAKPDKVTFVGVLSACSHAGLVRKGQRLFNSMSQAYKLEPKAEHYSCLVDLLGRAGHVDEAKRVVSQMPSSERDGVVLGALLSACRLHGDVGGASITGQELIELEPGSAGGYVLLANAYAASGQWDDVARMRRKMKEMKVKKVPGFSQIEVKNKSHLFSVGDRSHPQVEDIYAMIEDLLLPQMKEMGYMKGNSSVFV